MISIIITTYNSPLFLKLVLQSLALQSDKNFEVIVADDGSSKDTKDLIEEMSLRLPYSIEHVWQEDKGFRAAKIRNQAVACAKGEYLIFLDGDCLVLKNFISRHKKLAERRWFVAANRALLSVKATQEFLLLKDLPKLDFLRIFILWIQGKINRLLPFIFLPFNLGRKKNKNNWRGAKTCNLGIWKDDFIAVNGFDENFTGWGYEDSDLVVRLIRCGVLHKSGRFAIPVIHLWHVENSRNQEAANLQQLQKTINSNVVRVVKGVDQYLNICHPSAESEGERRND